MYTRRYISPILNNQLFIMYEGSAIVCLSNRVTLGENVANDVLYERCARLLQMDIPVGCLLSLTIVRIGAHETHDGWKYS